jgi:hypothetical protein
VTDGCVGVRACAPLCPTSPSRSASCAPLAIAWPCHRRAAVVPGLIVALGELREVDHRAPVGGGVHAAVPRRPVAFGGLRAVDHRAAVGGGMRAAVPGLAFGELQAVDLRTIGMGAACPARRRLASCARSTIARPCRGVRPSFPASSSRSASCALSTIALSCRRRGAAPLPRRRHARRAAHGRPIARQCRRRAVVVPGLVVALGELRAVVAVGVRAAAPGLAVALGELRGRPSRGRCGRRARRCARLAAALGELRSVDHRAALRSACASAACAALRCAGGKGESALSLMSEPEQRIRTGTLRQNSLDVLHP